MKEEEQTLPHVTITSPHQWNPSVLDSKVDDKWYNRSPPSTEYFDDMPFDAVGRLQDQPGDDDDDSDDDDRNHQAVDRAGIKAHLSNLIYDELQHEFTVCNIEPLRAVQH